MSVGPSVRRSVGHVSKLRAVLALQLQPNRPRLDCRVSGLVFVVRMTPELAKNFIVSILEVLVLANCFYSFIDQTVQGIEFPIEITIFMMIWTQ